MRVHHLDSCDAFVVFDLEDAPRAAGRIHQDRKIAEDDMLVPARSRTYQFAVFERQVGGAAAAVMAKPDARAREVKRFVAEIAPLVEKQELLVEPGPGVSADALRPLRAVDPRHQMFWTGPHQLRGWGAVAAASAAVGGLDGRRVGIEGFDAAGPAIVDAVTEAGGRVVALSTAKGSASSSTGFTTGEISDAYEFHGSLFVRELGRESGPPEDILREELDVLFVGSAVQLAEDGQASALRVQLIVPTIFAGVSGPTVELLQRSGIAVVPDFVSTAGPLFAASAAVDAEPDQVRHDAMDTIGTLVREISQGAMGMYEAACARAEAYVESWYGRPPGGRP